MYIAITLIVERLSGIPYIQFVQDHIFTPLGMHAATYNDTAAEVSGHLSQGFSLTALNSSDGDGWLKSVHRAAPYWLC